MASTHMTIEQARSLKRDDEIYSILHNNADGTNARYRITSVKLWKRSPQRIELRASRGLYEHVVIDERNIMNYMTSEQYAQQQAEQEAADRNEAMQHLPYRMQLSGRGHMYTRDGRFLRLYLNPQRWLRDNAHLVNEAVTLFYTLHEGRPAQEDILVLKVTLNDGRYMFMRWGDVELCRRFCYRTFADFRMTNEVYNYHRRVSIATKQSVLAGYYGTDR